MKRILPVLFALLVSSVACTQQILGPSKPPNAVEVSIIYAPESDLYLKEAIP
jgi:hypothetical protein